MTILSPGPVPKGTRSLADVGNIRRVAVATDRSETADRAVQWAAAFAMSIGAELLIIQVLPTGARGTTEAGAAAGTRARSAASELSRIAAELAGGRTPGAVAQPVPGYACRGTTAGSSLVNMMGMTTIAGPLGLLSASTWAPIAVVLVIVVGVMAPLVYGIGALPALLLRRTPLSLAMSGRPQRRTSPSAPAPAAREAVAA